MATNAQLVRVTHAMRLVKTLTGEPEDYYGLPAVAARHALEGSGCHSVCLNWLAHRAGWIPAHTIPPCPEEHGFADRWAHVMQQALVRFQACCETYNVVPYGIEQALTSQAYGLVGHVDLLAEMDYRGRRIKALWDLKFVRALLPSHRLQLRCYSRLHGARDVGAAFLFHCPRDDERWQLERVDLYQGLDAVTVVASAATLWRWKEGQYGAD